MLLYIVRHGEPDYSTDTLTERGQAQAQAVSDRLVAARIEEIYCSPMGRARQTAAPTAARLGLPIHIEPWAEELGSESQTPYPDSKMKNIFMVPSVLLASQENCAIPAESSFDECVGLRENGFIARYHYIAHGLDSLIERFGYRRDGQGFYEPIAPNDRRIALFCHAGMTRIALAHLFNLPYQMVGSRLEQYFTGVTVVGFKENPHGTLSPHLRTYGDIGHLGGDPF